MTDEHVTEGQEVDEFEETRPWSFLATKWYGYVFAAFFVLYGGVKIILGFLDRDYSDASSSVLFLIIGVILAGIAIGFRDGKRWGWYGLVAVNGLVVLLAVIGYSQALNFVYLVLSLAALGMLFMRQTKAEIF